MRWTMLLMAELPTGTVMFLFTDTEEQHRVVGTSLDFDACDRCACPRVRLVTCAVLRFYRLLCYLYSRN